MLQELTFECVIFCFSFHYIYVAIFFVLFGN